MKSHPLLGVLALGLLTASAARSGDVVQGTRGPAEVRELAHSAEILLRPGSAEIVVRRTLRNYGDVTDQAVVQIEGPPGASAVRLRTQGLAGGQPVWFEGELLDRDIAEARYRELTGVGMAIPKDPALLYWVGPGVLGLQVFPILAGQAKTVEYTFLAPVSYEAGQYRLALGPMQTTALAATARVRAEAASALFVAGVPAPQGTSLQLDGEATEASFERAAAPRLDGALAVVPISAERSLLRFRFEAARQLSQAPRGAAVAVVLDESRSLDEDEIMAGRALAASYLAQLPDARVALVPFDRVPRPAADRLLPSSEAVAWLASRPLAQRNGSHVDAALAKAASLLALAPASAPRRMLVLTDAITRNALSPTLLRRSFSATAALAHVAIATAGEPSLEPNDEHSWASVVRPTGGLVWDASAGELSSDPGALTARAVFEELVRPRRLRHLRLSGSDVDLGSLGAEPLEIPEELAEGEGLAAMRLVGGAPTRLALRGELWATPLRRVVTPLAEEGRVAAALAFGHELLWELSEAEQRTLAFVGRAVSPVTSYLAIEPGVRPSTDGLTESDASGHGLLGIGSGGGGRGVGIGLGSIGTMRPDELTEPLRAAWHRCGGRGAAALDVETTFVEIVDVYGATASVPEEKKHLGCLMEAAWAIELGGSYAAEHDVHHVAI